MFEVQLLIEVGRGRLAPGRSVEEIAADPRWLQDEPPAGPWFARAMDLTWTRDPFDRLIVAHARLRGWKLTTSDAAIIEHLSPCEVIAV